MAADKKAFIIYFNKEVHLHTQMYKMHPFFHYVKCLPAISFQDFTYGIIIPETPLPSRKSDIRFPFKVIVGSK